LFCCCCCFWDRVLLCSAGRLQTLDPPASASPVLGLQVYTTTAGSVGNFNQHREPDMVPHRKKNIHAFCPSHVN
jgi:hypothetical protein